MTRLLDLVVYMTLLTWLSIVLGAMLRNREWLPEATPLGGRAERAAANTKENVILFAALALTAQVAGLAEQATAGARLLLGAGRVPAGVPARPPVPGHGCGLCGCT